MTIQEAIRSKRPFKRKGWSGDLYLGVGLPNDLIHQIGSMMEGLGHRAGIESLLADDWIVKPAEPIVFECQFVDCGFDDSGVFHAISVAPYQKVLEPILDKKCRVTVEVLEG